MWVPLLLVAAVLFSFIRRKKGPSPRQFFELAISTFGLYGAVVMWQATWGQNLSDSKVLAQVIGAVGIAFMAGRSISRLIGELWTKPVTPEKAEPKSEEKNKDEDD